VLLFDKIYAKKELDHRVFVFLTEVSRILFPMDGVILSTLLPPGHLTGLNDLLDTSGYN
jgi:hypothetical protein